MERRAAGTRVEPEGPGVPLLDDPLVEYIGEIGDGEKQEFLGNAKVLLFPIDWPEPFGLVMIEAMACGTPVIALRRGAVPEIVEHGRTGFVVGDLDEAIAATERIGEISRQRCRELFEERFTAARMASEGIPTRSARPISAALRIVSPR